MSDKYNAVSSSSLIDLKGELNKQKESFNSTKHLGSTISSRKRPLPSSSTSTSSIFNQKRNKGLAARLAADSKSTTLIEDNRNPAHARSQLEKKAALYEKIRRGKTAGLSEAQIEALLVNFDEKAKGKSREESSSEEDSSEEDESATVPKRPVEDDPLVEWIDEMGRTRWVPRSEVPRAAAAPVYKEENNDHVYDKNVRYGDQQDFPVYAPDPDVLAARAALAAQQAPLLSHYDATAENRAKAAGQYVFSKNEEERAAQMEALKRDRERTEKAREEKATGGDEREKMLEERRRVLAEKKKEIARRKEERKKAGS